MSAHNRGQRDEGGQVVARPVKYVLQQTYTTAMRSRVIRDVVYDRWNSQEFADVYEHEKMLADRVRVHTYHEAIERLVGPDDVVVDLGTGTGILAMFAARRAKHVYAIDHSPFIDVAARIAAQNGFDNITFFQGHSTSFSPSEKVDVVIHEQMGDELLNENMVENLLDLKRRVMVDGGRILPGRFELYIEPVSLVDSRRVPHLGELDIHGVDFRWLEGDAALETYKRKTYGRRRITTGDVAHYLGHPIPVLTFDLDQMYRASQIPARFDVSRRVEREGILDGFCVWFRAILDAESTLSTAPLEPRTHWTNRLYRVRQREVSPGEELTYELQLDDPLRPASWTVALADAGLASC
jgi:type I protein arginine methyltransferase